MFLTKIYRLYGYAFLLIVSVALSGCATSDLQLKPSYQPSGETKGAGGALVLASSLEGTVPGVGERIQWILGEIKDTDGKVNGSVTSSAAPTVLVRDALQQELLRAGYAVRVDQALSKGVERGLVLNAAVLKLDETRSLIKFEADCRISFSVEIWLKGVKINTLSFESRFSDFAVKDREKLHQDVLQKAFAAAFKRAVPAIVEQLKN
jgi:hypothetical protein